MWPRLRTARRALLEGILLDDGDLDLDRLGDQGLQPPEGARQRVVDGGPLPRLDLGEQVGPGDQPVLDHLGHAGGELAGVERLQGRHVGDDRLGLLEQADQVPPLGPVEPDLAADARVDHGDEARRAVHEVDAPEVGRRHEPGDVLHHAGPQRHDGGRAVDVGVEQRVVDVLDRPERLAAVAGRESDLEVDVAAAGQVEIADAVVGDHDHRPLDRRRAAGRTAAGRRRRRTGSRRRGCRCRRCAGRPKPPPAGRSATASGARASVTSWGKRR